MAPVKTAPIQRVVSPQKSQPKYPQATASEAAIAKTNILAQNNQNVEEGVSRLVPYGAIRKRRSIDSSKRIRIPPSQPEW